MVSGFFWIKLKVSNNSCFTIGLTGGIASGKSTVSDLFEDLGCPVIDADVIARQVVEPNSIGLNQLTNTFGNEIILQDQTLDRKKLRNIVFNNNALLTQLNDILHPLIHKNIMNQIQQVKTHYCIIVIPLLCESNRYNWLDRVLVVDVSKHTQFTRLKKRDNITHELASHMIDSQCSREQRLNIADDVINNELSIDELQSHVKRLNSLYKSF
jgi:dephospho-CoA kinase